MAIPTKSSGAVVSSHGCISGHDVLNGTRSNVTVMRKSSSKRWTIIESVKLLAFTAFHLLLKSINLFPVLQNLLFFFWEVRSIRNYKMKNTE